MPGTEKKNPCGYLFAKYRFERNCGTARHGECTSTHSTELYTYTHTQTLLCSNEHPHIIQDDRTSIFTGLNPLNQLLAKNLKYVFVCSVCATYTSSTRRLGVLVRRTFLFAVLFLCSRWLKWMRVSRCCWCCYTVAIADRHHFHWFLARMANPVNYIEFT